MTTEPLAVSTTPGSRVWNDALGAVLVLALFGVDAIAEGEGTRTA